MGEIREHRLKTWPEYFCAIWSGHKNFEVRRNDRDFQIGDVLHLEEWSPVSNGYTGRAVHAEVEYVFHGGKFGLKEGFVVLGISLDV